MLEIIRGENLLDKRIFTIDSVEIPRLDFSDGKAEIIQNNITLETYTYADLSTSNFRSGSGLNEFVLEIDKEVTIQLSIGTFKVKYTMERISSEFSAYGKSVSCAIVIEFRVIA